jgi:DNA-binding NtrC family response regulator
MTEKILIIEDEQRLRRILKLVLQDAGYEVQTAADGREGILSWQEWRPDAVLTDLKMEPVDGLEVLRYSNQHGLNAPLIVLTAFGTVETAVRAMKEGAFDYLNKPVDNDKLLKIVARALASRPDPENNSYEMIGTSSAMQKIRQQIAQFAASDSTVLITGASGTGKELAAHALHAASARKSGPFIKVNCAAIPGELLENELFGHMRGSFTGASSDFTGAFSRADRGVLFLDEVGDLPLALQAKMLNAVEEKTITPLGSEMTLAVNVKILSATNHDLQQMIADKTFREDLYYRLNTVHIDMPRLRDRAGDIDMLLDAFLSRFSRAAGTPAPEIEQEVITCLNNWPWPGNVRELSNVVERAVLSCGDGPVTLKHLPRAMARRQAKGTAHIGEDNDLNARERQLIASVLHECGWNQTRAAQKLCITRNALRYRMKKFNINKR